MTGATPAIYRTRIVHARRAPVHYQFTHRSYSWYLDIDDPPRLPVWLRPFARFEACDHFTGVPSDSLRSRVDRTLAANGVPPPDGRVTALLQARVLGYVFNPLSLFWCHDGAGNLRALIAEVHNTYGQRHAYVLVPHDDPAGHKPVEVDKRMYVSPFNGVDGHYRIRAPRPGMSLDVVVTLHRSGQPPFVATMRGRREPATTARVALLQLLVPLAPLRTTIAINRHGLALWLRRLPVIARPKDPGTPRPNGHRP